MKTRRSSATMQRERMVDAIREILGLRPLYGEPQRLFDAYWMGAAPRRERVPPRSPAP